MSTRYLVGVYLCDRAYGGPEEGGWWYTTGELCRAIRVFGNLNRALEHAWRLQMRLDATLNRGRRDISSVLSTGRYYAEVHDDTLPDCYPSVRPHYE